MTSDERERLLSRIEDVLRTKAAREAESRERFSRRRAARAAATTMISVRVPKSLRDAAARTLRRHDLTFADAIRTLLTTLAGSEGDPD